MQGVPQQFSDEKDRARFRHLEQLPALNCTMPISPATPLSRTPTRPLGSASLNSAPSAFVIAVAST